MGDTGPVVVSLTGLLGNGKLDDEGCFGVDGTSISSTGRFLILSVLTAVAIFDKVEICGVLDRDGTMTGSRCLRGDDSWSFSPEDIGSLLASKTNREGVAGLLCAQESDSRFSIT